MTDEVMTIGLATTLAEIRQCARIMDESPWEPSDLLENVMTDTVEIYIARSGPRKKIVGFAIVEVFPDANDPAHPGGKWSLLSYIYTAKRGRKSGRGRQIMDFVHDSLRARGYLGCRIQFNSTVDELYTFYTNIGYTPVCLIHGYYTPTEPAWYMEYLLSPTEKNQ